MIIIVLVQETFTWSFVYFQEKLVAESESQQGEEILPYYQDCHEMSTSSLLSSNNLSRGHNEDLRTARGPGPGPPK